MEISKCWKIVNLQKIQLKWKLVKHFARFKQRAASRKLFSLPPPHQIRPFCVFGIKIFLGRYTKIYRHSLSSASRMHFLGVKKWCSANVLSDIKLKYACWKICKMWKVFGSVSGAFIFTVKWVEVCKMNEDFCAKLYCKMSGLFTLVFVGFETFCQKTWNKKTLRISTATCGWI